MLWDAVYNATTFRNGITLGTDGFSINDVGRFTYSFVTVPTVKLEKIKDFQKAWHSKAFAPALPIDQLELDESEVSAAIKFILSLNPHPAAGFVSDSTKAGIQAADIALVVEKKSGSITVDDFERGLIRIDDKNFFEIKC